MNGIGMGLFAAPNMAGIMNSSPPDKRGAASGMRATFQNSGMVLSVGVFFSLMIVGLVGDACRTRWRWRCRRTASSAGEGAPDLVAAAGRQPLRRVPRLQPDAEVARQRARGRA